MRVHVDPEEPVESELSRAVVVIHQELLGHEGATVHAHLDGDALIFVTEGFSLGRPAEDLRAKVLRAISQLTIAILGRELDGDALSVWPQPGLVVTVLRLRAGAGRRSSNSCGPAGSGRRR